jgi:hypothetical protein
MMKLFVHTTLQLEDSERETGEQAAWREDWHFDIKDVTLREPSSGQEYETFDLDADIKFGDTVYLLVLRWTDGDSYGHAYGKGEVMWVFKDPLLAQEGLKRWQFACDEHGDWRHDNKEQFASFRVDGGEIRKMSNPAYCYFARVDALRLEPKTVV